MENETENESKENILKGFKPSKTMIIIGLILLPIILVFLLLISPIALIGFVFNSYFNYRSEILTKKQKHQRALKSNFLDN